jgi:hypothetical protein
METLEQALEHETKRQRWIGIKLFIDVWIHPVAFIFILFSLMRNEGDTAFCLFYFGIGGYQFLSAMIHLSIPNAFEKRKAYYFQLLLYLFMFVLIAVGFALPYFNLFLILLFFLLILTPLTAVYYFIISIRDHTEFINQKWH